MKRPNVKATDLPPDVKASDLKYPDRGQGLGYDKLLELGLQHSGLRFYQTNGFGWVLTTLLISNASRRQAAGTTARSYGITLEGKVVRVGRGPHVTKEIEVFLSKDNYARLAKYVELWKKGAGDAGQIRDRISSRRAQGQLYREQGRTSWRWDS